MRVDTDTHRHNEDRDHAPLAAPDELERLITRQLDGELSDAESDRLEACVASDPAAAELQAELHRIDAVAGYALRATLGRDVPTLLAPEPAPTPAAPSRWRLPRLALLNVGAAACIALLLSSSIRSSAPVDADRGSQPAQASNWQWADLPTPPLETADVPEQVHQALTGERHLDRQWLVVPGDTPDEAFLIEITRLRLNAEPVQAEF